MLDKNIKVFIVYITFLNLKSIYLTWKTQIGLLLTKKIIVLAKYLDFIEIYLKKWVKELFEYLDINKYAIDLEKNK